MKTTTLRVTLLSFLMLFMCYNLMAQSTNKAVTKTNQKDTTMKTYVIERNIPDAGKLSAEELKAISQTSCGVLKQMGPQIEWVQSYVTGDKIFCVYKAQNEELLREHAAKGGFPINNVYQVANVISPATAQ